MNNNNNLLFPGTAVIVPEGDTLLCYADPDVIETFETSSYDRVTR